MGRMVDAQSAFLLDLCMLIAYATRLGWKVTAGELWRPVEMQKIYVQTGRSKTMNSDHLKRLAGDLNFFNPKGEYVCSVAELKEFGDYWEKLHPKNYWGGYFNSFKDAPHFGRKL